MDPRIHRAQRDLHDRFDRHVHRTGAYEAADRDPYASFQLDMLRWFLDVVHSACDDEHVDPEVTARILDRVIYGAVPQRPAVNEMQAERERMRQYIRADVRPTPIVVSPDTMERIKAEMPGGREAAADA